MQFKLIAPSLRVDGPASGGSESIKALPPRPGGKACRTAQYSIEILQASGDHAKVGLKLRHGPNEFKSVLHSTPIGTTQLTTGINLLVGDADQTKIIGEWLHVEVVCISADANPCWAMINVYELLKPF